MNAHEVLGRGIDFGNELLQNYIDSHDNNDTYSMVLLGLFRKIVELSDGVWVCADHELRGPSDLNYRGLIEASLAFKYILEDEELAVNRAIAYKIGYHKHQIEAANYSLQNDNLSHDERMFFENAIQGHERMLEDESFANVLEEWNNLQQRHRRNYPPKWYSLYSGPNSINALAIHLADTEEDSELMANLYSFLSINAHNYLALRDYLNTTPNVQGLAGIRYALSPDLSEFNLIPTRALLISSILAFTQALFPEYLERLGEFANEIREYLSY
ncbi:DUF5677 domain-containing protein [Bacillus sp. BD59S]|uniref:DUF5677 domain-containing protein n=1 Tax=Bacillus sp. BD59S TaxID=2499213 RepID=UPI00117C6324|nr:DUF5677 domain-containing protein [Bacillus sp. BD59S]QDQ03675.1 hypothetical protein EKQ63_00435 [Bacillus sp. BD59S]